MALSEDLRVSVGPLWDKTVRHPFVLELGDGTLPENVFRVYFEQDYLFLKDWMQLLGLGVAKSPDFDSARSICAFLNGGLIGEEALFRQVFRGMGLSDEDVNALQPLPTTLAYGAYLKSIAFGGSYLEIATALLAIEWPYLQWAQDLNALGKKPGNPHYQAWIDIHDSEAMRDIVAAMRKDMDESVDADRERLLEVFHRAMRYEYMFWEMPYRGEAWPG